MIPLAAADDIDNTETDDMTKMVQTGAIPESLLNDILKQAGTYMSLYNTNPSQFLKGFGIGKKLCYTNKNLFSQEKSCNSYQQECRWENGEEDDEWNRFTDETKIRKEVSCSS